jgi:hypothetical protein
MTSIPPSAPSRLTSWIRRGRDVLEFGSHLPRNSPVTGIVHTVMGMGGAAAITLGGAAMISRNPADPNDPGAWDRDSWLHSSRNAVTGAGVLTVLITAGMQFATPQHQPLSRGLSPMYFLGVGAYAWGNFALPKIQQAYAE